MMYTTYELDKTPYFNMEREKFNSLVNSLREENTPLSKEVKIGLLIRSNGNLVAKRGNTILHQIDLKQDDTEGYFTILKNTQQFIYDYFGSLPFSVIRNTVLMPIGAFESEGNIIIYMNLIVSESVLDNFNTNTSIDFVHIDKLNLKKLDKGSIMVLPTLNLVSEK